MFETLSKLAKKLFGDANERELKKLRPLVAQINSLEPRFEKLSDEQLAAKTVEFKQKIENGAPLDDLLCEAFATVREAGKRVMNMRHYDCQMIGGIVLHEGRIAEMRTGEGKTLVGTLPVYLNALTGRGAHVVTVNDYLAERDAQWMRPLYNFLGMEVGIILSNERDDAKKRYAYTRDITYGTNNEFGFDYLRDNMKFSLDKMVQQRGHHFAIIDEVDSILIDEARTPLIISGPADADVGLYKVVDRVVPMLQNEIDFNVDEKGRSITLTDEGIHKVEDKLGVGNLYDPQNMEVLHHLTQCLKAHYLFKRDRDYMVREGEVIIVDEFTGRLMTGRRWSDGLHQAVEAKEKVEVQRESQVYATITYQNLFRMYEKLSGMTGTAATEAAEFASTYDLDTMIIPTNRPIARLDAEDIIYRSQMEKFDAVCTEISTRHAAGQPILVGTTSVERSEIVSRILSKRGITHEVLNAKNHHREALIIAQAGRSGSVTISTNMAGRGTDIKLGGNAEALAELEVSEEVDPEGYKAAFARHLDECQEDEQRVLNAGGLYVIGTARHESRRVDNQLRGRSGRQGDPGGSRFYLSLEDDLLKMFGSDKYMQWMERMGLEDNEPIEHPWITKSVENAQRKVEGHNFNIRKNLLEYDDVMNYQRKGIYQIRNRALKGEEISEMLDESVQNIVQDIFDDYLGEGQHPEKWNLEKMRTNLDRVFGISWEESDEVLRDDSRQGLVARMEREALEVLHAKRSNWGEESYTAVGRQLLLQLTDQLWKDHLLALDRLRQGVGLRGYGQRNPLLEYKREALQMYMMMGAMRDEELITQVISMSKEVADQLAGVPGQHTAQRMKALGISKAEDLFKKPEGIPQAPAQPAPEPEPMRQPEPGEEARLFAHRYGLRRNDPCACGSGKKFKKCCYEANWEPPEDEEDTEETEQGASGPEITRITKNDDGTMQVEVPAGVMGISRAVLKGLAKEQVALIPGLGEFKLVDVADEEGNERKMVAFRTLGDSEEAMPPVVIDEVKSLTQQSEEEAGAYIGELINAIRRAALSGHDVLLPGVGWIKSVPPAEVAHMLPPDVDIEQLPPFIPVFETDSNLMDALESVNQ